VPFLKKAPYAVDLQYVYELLFLGQKQPLTVFAGANIKPFFLFRKIFSKLFSEKISYPTKLPNELPKLPQKRAAKIK